MVPVSKRAGEVPWSAGVFRREQVGVHAAVELSGPAGVPVEPSCEGNVTRGPLPMFGHVAHVGASGRLAEVTGSLEGRRRTHWVPRDSVAVLERAPDAVASACVLQIAPAIILLRRSSEIARKSLEAAPKELPHLIASVGLAHQATLLELETGAQGRFLLGWIRGSVPLA